MIDFHTHLLPGIDDGSRDPKMTEAMLREEKRQGVETVIATPHFYADQTPMGRFLEKRAEAMERTERIRQEADETLPEVIAGAEVYYFPGIGNAEGIDRLCIGSTKIILLEMPFAQWNDSMLKDVEALINRQGFHIILAHVERYIGFQKDKIVWNSITSMPLTVQINAGSFVKDGSGTGWRRSKMQKFCLKSLTEYPNLVIGSDCHNLTERPPNMAAARAEIAARAGTEAYEQIKHTAERLLTET